MREATRQRWSAAFFFALLMGALVVVASIAVKGCTIPSSVEYKCDGGKKVEIETHHEVAVFGVPFIATKQRGAVVGTCTTPDD